MNMGDLISDIRLLKLDKLGGETSSSTAHVSTRISIIGTSLADSHHLQFHVPVTREQLSQSLHELADRVSGEQQRMGKRRRIWR